jgi:hypothetical protein
VRLHLPVCTARKVRPACSSEFCRDMAVLGVSGRDLALLGGFLQDLSVLGSFGLLSAVLVGFSRDLAFLDAFGRDH